MWNCYADIANLSASQDGALFPFALSAKRERNGGDLLSQRYCLFVFEMPNCIQLQPLLKLTGAMAEGLRKNPDILLLWASQLGQTYKAICQKKSGHLINGTLKIENIFVREVIYSYFLMWVV